jgi:hypothetical protein
MTAVLLAVIAVNTVNKSMLYYVKEMAIKGAIVFGLIFITDSIMSPDESRCLVPISLMAIYTGCSISTLHTSYYSKYIIACAIMAATALSVRQRESVNDSYVNYKSQVKVDRKTADLLAARAKHYDQILCDKYFNRILTNSDYGYVDDYTPLKCLEGNHYYQWIIYSNHTTNAQVQLERENEDFEKKHTIYIGDYQNEIYRRKEGK